MAATPNTNDVLGSFANYNAITGPPLPGSVGNLQGTAPPPNGGITPGQQIIPDAGVYGQETAAATNAYNTAVTNALAQRNALYNQRGLLNNGQVDPNNPYGQYEQMLNSEASQLTADEQNAAGRNLGRGGLANQQVSTDRNAQAAQNFAFQQNVAADEANYQQALQDALSTKTSAVDQAYQDAMNTALQNMILNMQMGNYGGNGAGGDNSSDNNNNSTPPPPAPVQALFRLKKTTNGNKKEAA